MRVVLSGAHEFADVFAKLTEAQRVHRLQFGVPSDNDLLAILRAEHQRGALGRPLDGVSFEASFHQLYARLGHLPIPKKFDPSRPNPIVPPSEAAFRMRLRAALKRVGWSMRRVVKDKDRYIVGPVEGAEAEEGEQ